MDKAHAQKDLLRMLTEAMEGTYYTLEEVKAHMADLLTPKNIVFLTGDTHGCFDRVHELCQK